MKTLKLIIGGLMLFAGTLQAQVVASANVRHAKSDSKIQKDQAQKPPKPFAEEKKQPHRMRYSHRLERSEFPM